MVSRFHAATVSAVRRSPFPPLSSTQEPSLRPTRACPALQKPPHSAYACTPANVLTSGQDAGVQEPSPLLCTRPCKQLACRSNRVSTFLNACAPASGQQTGVKGFPPSAMLVPPPPAIHAPLQVYWSKRAPTFRYARSPPPCDAPACVRSPHELTRPGARMSAAARGGVTLQRGVRTTLCGVRAAAPDA
eukprot:358726-Chlamydomonas_euryale.AAC.4